jgi:hypothetical protein
MEAEVTELTGVAKGLPAVTPGLTRLPAHIGRSRLRR